MKAMVLAAGQGTRLHPLTEHTPKALVPVAGRPMIEYSLLLLRRYGIRDIIINLHHLGDQIEHYLGDGKQLGLQITYSKEPELLDTGGGLLKAKPFLQDGTFVVINTDVLIDLSLSDSLLSTKKPTRCNLGFAAGSAGRSVRLHGDRWRRTNSQISPDTDRR
jgi:NDP-sugar pyrophosphorylase family protein